MRSNGGRPIILNVNGQRRHVAPGASRTLLDVLRDDLDLTGAKKACDNGECGSCIVLMGRKPAKACLLAPGRAVGRDVSIRCSRRFSKQARRSAGSASPA